MLSQDQESPYHTKRRFCRREKFRGEDADRRSQTGLSETTASCRVCERLDKRQAGSSAVSAPGTAQSPNRMFMGKFDLQHSTMDPTPLACSTRRRIVRRITRKSEIAVRMKTPTTTWKMP